MALSDRLTSTGSGASVMPGVQCTLMAARASMPPTEQDALDTMMGSRLSAFDIYLALHAEGYKVGQHTVERHRSERCRCVTG